MPYPHLAIYTNFFTPSMLALSIQEILGILLNNKKASLAASSKRKEIYLQILSVYEVSLDLSAEKLSKHIRNLAFKHGLLTYGRIILRFHKQKTKPDNADSIFSKMIKGVRSESRKDA